VVLRAVSATGDAIRLLLSRLPLHSAMDCVTEDGRQKERCLAVCLLQDQSMLTRNTTIGVLCASAHDSLRSAADHSNYL
jgi:hypothetical protein